MSREATKLDKVRVINRLLNGVDAQEYYIGFNALAAWGITEQMVNDSAEYATTTLGRALWVVKQLD